MRIWQRASSAWTRDLDALRGAFRGEAPSAPPAGLHFWDRHGKRLHLRLQDDGSGMLFVDVTDVVHLSETAAHLAWLVLSGADDSAAVQAMRASWGGASVEALRGDLARMRRTVDGLASEDGCPTCAVELPRTALFGRRARAPHKVDLALTYACNNDCPHCYNEPDRFDLDSLPTDAWRAVLDKLASVGVPHVIFTGGEATLHPGLIDLIAHAHALGMVAGLNTNGRGLSRGGLAERLRVAGLDHVQITLESHVPAVHDAMVAAPRAFGQTVAGVRAALAAGLHVLTNTTITRANAGALEDTVDFLHGLGLRTFAMNGMIYSGGGHSNPDALPSDRLPPLLIGVRDRARELSMRFLWYTVTEYCELSPVELEIGAKRCNAGEYSMCVEPDGSVLPCQSYYTSAGHILRDPWETIWKGALFRSFRDREADPDLAKLPTKCRSCPDLPLCGGGCRIEREVREGDAPGGCQSCASGGVRSSGASAGAAGFVALGDVFRSVRA
jgi:radical SAM protein with 4Fe4S-binding SPASM domain